MNYKKVLKDLRKRNWSERRIANHLGVNQSQVWRWMNDKAVPTDKNLDAIMEMKNISK
jgi:transcriptional regulator with XRE-family HTH domain